MDSLLRLNISGSPFFIGKQLAVSSGSLLFHLINSSHEEKLQFADAYLEDRNEYFFCRSPYLFKTILHFHLTGELHKPENVSLARFNQELEFWRINPKRITVPSCEEEELMPNGDGKLPLRMNSAKDRLWHFCEGDGSRLSTGFQLLSFGFICVSIAAVVLSTIDYFRVPASSSSKISSKNVTKRSRAETQPHPVFEVIENVCIGFFTLEYILRLLLAPHKLAFLKEFLNIIDITVILSSYLELLGRTLGINVRGALTATMVLRVLRVLRVARILRLFRFSKFSQKFGIAVRSVCKRLLASFVLIIIMIVFFSTFVYYAEEGDDQSPITSIPMAFWFCIATMSTVGYGDVVPVTVLGKLIGSVAIVAGVLVLALPITIIVSNFGNSDLIKQDDEHDGEIV